jgi:hypothetical protein
MIGSVYPASDEQMKVFSEVHAQHARKEETLYFTSEVPYGRRLVGACMCGKLTGEKWLILKPEQTTQALFIERIILHFNFLLP